MDSFPFMSYMNPENPFGVPLIQAYDLSFFDNQEKYLPPKIEAKVEEGTASGTVKQQQRIQQVQQPFQQQLDNRTNRRFNKKEDDQDYRPNKKIRGSNRQPKQKQDRNLIPNTVHHLLSYVQKQFKSRYLVEKIFKSLNPQLPCSIQRYYNYHKLIRGKINHYVNEQAMKLLTATGAIDYQVYSLAEQEFYSKVSRIVISRFLKIEAVMMILLSKKVKKHNIIEHLSVQRFLWAHILVQEGC